jgi:hypothetical protein
MRPDRDLQGALPPRLSGGKNSGTAHVEKHTYGVNDVHQNLEKIFLAAAQGHTVLERAGEALVMVSIIAKEGVEALRGERCCDDDGCQMSLMIRSPEIASSFIA